MKTKLVSYLLVAVMILSAFAMVSFSTEPTYATTTTGYVYYNETGLPSGTEWSVLYNSLNLSSTTTSIKFSETVNILYSYTVHTSYSGVTAYSPSPASGSAKAPSTVSISFSGSTFTANLTTNYNPTDEDLKTWYYSDPSGPAPSGHYYVVFPYIDGVNTTTMSVSSNGVVYDGYYLWSETGSNTIYFFYHVNGTNLGFDSVTLTVTVNPLLSVTISAGQSSIDYGQSVTFESSVSGGTPPYSYQWILNDANVTGATNSTWTTSTLPIGTDYIKLQVSDSVGDPSGSKGNASIPTIITQDNLGTNNIYVGDAVNISIDRISDIILRGNYTDFAFQWYGPGGPISGATHWYLNVVEDTAGFYNFAVHIKILNDSLPYHGIWIGHYHLRVKNNVLPTNSVEFIESGLPTGAVWSAALFSSVITEGNTTYPNGTAIQGVDGYYTTVGGNGLPTVIISPPNGTYHFFVNDYKWAQMWPGSYGWMSPGNYTPSITNGIITFPADTANGSVIIYITFTRIGDPPSNSSPAMRIAPLNAIRAFSTMKEFTLKNKVLPIGSKDPTVPPIITKTSVSPVSKPTLNFISFIFVSLVGIAAIISALMVQRNNRKKQRDKEVND